MAMSRVRSPQAQSQLAPLHPYYSDDELISMLKQGMNWDEINQLAAQEAQSAMESEWAILAEECAFSRLVK